MKTKHKIIHSDVYTDPDTKFEIFLNEMNGAICPYFFHDSKIGKQFAGYFLILKDIEFAKSCFINLKENKVTDKELRAALLFSGIFTYMKCFTAGNSRGTNLNENLFKSVTMRFQLLHEEIRDFRNKYLAHASTETYETAKIVLFLNPDVSVKEWLNISVAAKYVTDRNDKVEDYLDLMDKVIELVDIKMQKKLEALEKEVDGINIDELYEKAKTPNKEK
jgi:hypothetical protein